MYIYTSAIIISDLNNVSLQRFRVGIISWDEIAEGYTIIVDISSPIQRRGVGYRDSRTSCIHQWRLMQTYAEGGSPCSQLEYSSRTTRSPGVSGKHPTHMFFGYVELASSGPTGRENVGTGLPRCHGICERSLCIEARGPSVWILSGCSGDGRQNRLEGARSKAGCKVGASLIRMNLPYCFS